MKIRLTVFALILAMGAAASFAQEHAQGQVWSYKTRPGEEASTLLINKIESDANLGEIFHITVSDVRMKNKHAPGGVTTELQHFPVAPETLEASCVKLIRLAKPNPDYAEGYAQWRRAFTQGRAGIFAVPVSEIVQIIEATANK